MNTKGTKVLARKGSDIRRKGITGVLTGGSRMCTLEGCGGEKVGVRWSDGKISWPCIRGMKEYSNGTLEIM